MSRATERDAIRSQVLVERIRPMLAGERPEVVGAALADLTAIWLAGHVGPDAEAMRSEILDMHVAAIRDLVPINVSIESERAK